MQQQGEPIKIPKNHAEAARYGRRHFSYVRKAAVKPGEKIFINYRNKTLRSTNCTAISDIYIGSNHTVIIDNKLLTESEMQELAIEDGANSVPEFFEKIKSMFKLPFEGQLIRWL